MKRGGKKGGGLYLVTPPRIGDAEVFGERLKEALSGGGVRYVQLRLKGEKRADVFRAARVLGPIARTHGAFFIVNDDAEIAREAGADGVHVGQGDMPCGEAREIVGVRGIVGVTCHGERALALLAAEGGADYVAFGSFYETATKPGAKRAEPEILNWWRSVSSIPSVAIGGIRSDNGGLLIESGADYLAVSSGVWDHEKGARFSVGSFRALFEGEEA